MALLPGCDEGLPDVVVQPVQTTGQGDRPISLSWGWLANQDDLIEQGLSWKGQLGLAVDQDV
eukprot:1879890-Heterocapsa_arctica.AAC.1